MCRSDGQPAKTELRDHAVSRGAEKVQTATDPIPRPAPHLRITLGRKEYQYENYPSVARAQQHEHHGRHLFAPRCQRQMRSWQSDRERAQCQYRKRGLNNERRDHLLGAALQNAPHQQTQGGVDAAKRHHSVRNPQYANAQVFCQEGGCSRLHDKERTREAERNPRRYFQRQKDK